MRLERADRVEDAIDFLQSQDIDPNTESKQLRKRQLKLLLSALEQDRDMAQKMAEMLGLFDDCNRYGNNNLKRVASGR